MTLDQFCEDEISNLDAFSHEMHREMRMRNSEGRVTRPERSKEEWLEAFRVFKGE